MVKNIKIEGMHCASCEVLIERRFKKIEGVEKVHVNHATGEVEIICSKELSIEQLQESIKDTKYKVLPNSTIKKGTITKRKKTFDDYFEIIAFFVIVVGVYYFLKQMNLLPSIGISENMSYWVVFLIGLVAAMSTCLALSGGLLLAATAKYNEIHPNLTGWQKFKPNIYFNIGRIFSYTVLGGIIGAFGSALTLSSRTNGVLTIIASIAMLLLGFQLLKIFPNLARFQPKIPKFFSHKIHDAATKEHLGAPFLLGCGTFFLPCGFTIALQLYVLSKGSIITGALTMLVFSLGTLPSLISLGAITSYIKGSLQKDFLKFAGVVVILLGILNIPSGLTLVGINFDLFPSTQVAYTSTETQSDIDTSNINPFIANYIKSTRAPEQKVEIVDGKQIAKMKIVDLNYFPAKFIIKKGIPVEWEIDASKAAGCAQVITASKLRIFKYLSPSKINKIEFTPQSEGRITFSCTMGMTTSGASFNVV